MNGLTPEIQDKWPLLLVWIVMLGCAIYCRFTLKFPNLVTLPLLFAGLGLGFVHDSGRHPDGGIGGLEASLCCVVLVLVLQIPLYSRGRFPAGGVKLQMAFAAWVGAFYGLARGLPIVLVSSLLSPLIMLGLMWAKEYTREADAPCTYEGMPIGFIMSFVAIASTLSLDLLVYGG